MTGSSRRLAIAGPIAALAGGLCWVIKAAGIMATGVQPPVVFEIAPLFFALAVVGLFHQLDVPRPQLAVTGLVIAWIAEVAGLVAVAGLFLGPAEWTPSGSTVTVLTPFITVAAFGSVVALLLVGIVARRTAVLPSRWSALPVFLAVSTIPLIALGPVLQAINPRLFELPTLLIGIQWMALGAVMARPRPDEVSARAAT